MWWYIFVTAIMLCEGSQDPLVAANSRVMNNFSSHFSSLVSSPVPTWAPREQGCSGVWPRTQRCPGLWMSISSWVPCWCRLSSTPVHPLYRSIRLQRSSYHLGTTKNESTEKCVVSSLGGTKVVRLQCTNMMWEYILCFIMWISGAMPCAFQMLLCKHACTCIYPLPKLGDLIWRHVVSPPLQTSSFMSVSENRHAMIVYTNCHFI